MIGNTGNTQPIKVPGLPLCMRFRGKPDDLKKITIQVDQATEKYLSDGSVALGNGAESTELPDMPRVNPLPAKALPAAVTVQIVEDVEDSSLYEAEASAQAPEEQSEENLLVVRPRPAERRAEDFMRDWMRRFTRS